MESNDELKEINIKNRWHNQNWRFYFDNILLDEISYENILVYDISCKALIGAKSLRVTFDKKMDLLEFMMELDI